MKGTVTFNSILKDNTGYKLAFWQENKMHLVQIAKKPNQTNSKRKDKTVLEQPRAVNTHQGAPAPQSHLQTHPWQPVE